MNITSRGKIDRLPKALPVGQPVMRIMNWSELGLNLGLATRPALRQAKTEGGLLDVLPQL